MKKEIIQIQFKEGQYKVYDESLKQWNYSQRLAISGLDILDEIVEVHFSLKEYGGLAERMLGTVTDGVIDVGIPVFVLEGPEWSRDYYSAWAWIYLSDDKSAETVRKIEFTIEARPKPEDCVCPEEQDDFIKEIQKIMNETKEVAQSVRNDADNGEFDGQDGKDGVDGKSAYRYAKEGGYTGTEEEFAILMAEAGKTEVDDALSEESTNPVQNKVLTKEVNTLKEHNTQLKETIEKLQIKVTTDKAPFHNIKDSANYRVLDFGMEGKNEQKTTSGKNKLDTSSLSEQTINGVTFTPVYTNNLLEYILVNGTATANAYYKMNLCDNTYLTYDLAYNGCPSGGSLETYAFIHHVSGRTDSGNGQTLPANSQTDNKFSISVAKGVTVSNLKFYPMVRLATKTDATYEPYTGDMASPNPDFEQEVENAGVYNEATGRYEIGCRVVNKNLLPNNPKDWTMGYKVYWGAGAGTEVGYMVSAHQGYVDIDVLPNTNVCFHNDTTDKYWVSRIVELDENDLGLVNHPLYDNIVYNYENYSFQTKENTTSIRFQVRLVDDTQTFTEADLQEMKIAFGYGDSVSYEPHASQPFTLTSPVPLTKWDKLVKRDGVYGWSINHEKFNPKGQVISSISYRDETSGVCTFSVPNAVATQVERIDIKCNRAIAGNVSEGNIGKFRIYNNTLQVRLTYPEGITQSNSDTETKAAFKEMFNNTEYLFEYQTSTEQSFHPLPDEEQTLLNNLETYYGVTNLYNDQGCPTWLTYVADPKLYLDNQLLEIKSAIV